jgi:phage/plasmid-like protein (TIGR03299 family)
MSHMVSTMFSNREKPWHGLGVIVQDAPTSAEAIRVAGLDWDVQLEPVGLTSNSEPIPGYFATVRQSDKKTFGIVTDRYKIVQNREAFEWVDLLLEHDVVYETAGCLTDGRTWLLAKMEGKEILGDAVNPYLVFQNSFDGKGAIRVALTPIRVVCNNTLTLALRDAQRQWSTRHMGDMNAKLAEASHTLKLANNYMAQFDKYAKAKEKQRVNDKIFNDLVNALFPLVEVDGPRKLGNILEMRQELNFRYQEAPDIKQFKGTAWGVLQAVTDMISHTAPRRNTATYAENRFVGLVDGNKIIEKAQELLEEIA